MNKRLKTILSIIATILLITATSLSVACREDEPPAPTTVTVTYVYDNNEQDYVATVIKGNTAVEPQDPTNDGYTFKGWYNGSSKYDFSLPVNEDIILTAKWEKVVVAPTEYTVTLKDYDFLTYNGELTAGTYTLEKGSIFEISFTLSPYYEGTPVVYANNKVLKADENGIYSLAVDGNYSINVSGIVPQSRTIEGLGTYNNPYLIKNETQYEQFMARVNSSSDSRYNEAYVRLEADLDFMGAELTPVGKELNVSHFSGVFDGNGHTISNFEINEEGGVIGLFGYLVQGTVTNLTVKTDWNLEMIYENNYIVGGIVGYNMGGDVYGCNFEGTITTEFYYERPYVFLGGIVGFMQGYSTDWFGSIAYCTSKANMVATGINPLYAVGGIVGSMVGTAQSAPALVHNCTYNGEISGYNSMVGGIAGYMRKDSAIANCYASGSYQALSGSGFAIAGGIVGLAENECAVEYCLTNALCTTQGESDSDYISGTVVGAKYKNGEEIKNRPSSVDGKPCVELEVINDPNGSLTEEVYQQLKEKFGWVDDEWSFENGELKVKFEGADQKQVVIKVNFSGETVTNEGLDGNPLTLSEDQITTTGYYTLYSLYGGSGKNTFVADSGKISYGFYLDKDCTQRLPASLILTKDVTVYVGFADYSEVQGEYYVTLTAGERKITARLVFDDNGKMSMEYDGRVANYMYVYDGSKILISDGYFANFIYQNADGSLVEADFYAIKNANGLTIYDNIYFTETNEEDYAKPLSAKTPSPALGSWYDLSGNEYIFNPDGSGVVITASERIQFNYTSAGNEITFTVQGKQITATVLGSEMVDDSSVLFSKINRFDDFAGTWEGDFSKNFKISFDGKGTLTVEGNKFAYTVDGDILTYDGGSATFDQNGLLVLTYNGEKLKLGKEGSFIGYWKETLLNYEVELYGIGRYGYGYGYDNNGVYLTYTSEVDTSGLGSYHLSFYYRTSLYGYAYSVTSSNDGSEMLYAAIYTEAQGALWDNYNLCYEDHFKGVWNSGEGISLDFNGFGRYDVYYDDVEGLWVVQGEVEVTKGEQSEVVRYHFSKEKESVSFTYGGVVYTGKIESGDLILTSGSGSVIYRRADRLGGIMFEGENLLVGFNGKSNVGCGIAMVSLNGSDLVEYTYTLDGYNLTLTGDNKTFTGKLNEQTKMLELTLGSDSYSLGFFSLMNAKSYISSSGLEIEFIGYFNLDGDGKMTIDGEEYSVVYADENNSVVYANGSILYYIVAQDYNNIAVFDAYGEYLALFTVADGWQGEYIAEDGSVLKLDGMGYCIEGYYAVATITTANGKVSEFVYQIDDEQIVINLLDRNGDEDLLIPTYILSKNNANGAIAFVKGDQTFYLVKI